MGRKRARVVGAWGERYLHVGGFRIHGDGGLVGGGVRVAGVGKCSQLLPFLVNVSARPHVDRHCYQENHPVCLLESRGSLGGVEREDGPHGAGEGGNS